MLFLCAHVIDFVYIFCLSLDCSSFRVRVLIFSRLGWWPHFQDFPREGNNDSYHYARRRYDLADDPLLKYQYLEKWEGAMHALERRYQWLVGTRGGALTSVAEVEPSHEYVSRKHEGDKVLVFERGPLVFIFNFHPTNSYQDYQVGVPSNIGRYLAVLSSDEEEFGGFSNVQAHGAEFWVEDSPFDGRPGSIKACTFSLSLSLCSLASSHPHSFSAESHSYFRLCSYAALVCAPFVA